MRYWLVVLYFAAGILTAAHAECLDSWFLAVALGALAAYEYDDVKREERGIR